MSGVNARRCRRTLSDCPKVSPASICRARFSTSRTESLFSRAMLKSFSLESVLHHEQSAAKGFAELAVLQSLLHVLGQFRRRRVLKWPTWIFR